MKNKLHILTAVLLALLLTCFVSLALADSLNLDVSKLTLNAGQKYTITAVTECTDGLHAGAQVKYSSTKKSVATVTSSGKVTAKASGTCYIKAVWGDITVKVKVKVKPAVTSVKLSDKELKLDAGDQKKLGVSLNSGSTLKATAPVIKWSSSKNSVATVDESGYVTGISAGTCYITAKSYNGIKAKVKVTVNAPKSKYRALLVGNEDYEYEKPLYSSPNNLSAMKSLLSRTTSGYSVKKLEDCSAGDMLTAISTVFADADSNDVSLLYYCGHSNSDGEMIFVDGTYVTGQALYSALNKIPGKVIVILDTCYSGMIIDEDVDFSAVRSSSASPAAFNSKMISLFRKDTVEDVWSDNVAASGSLRTNKFVVLTSAASDEESWNIRGNASTGYFYGIYCPRWASVFTMYLTEAAGWNYQRRTACELKGDEDGNGTVSLKEAQKYTNDGLVVAMEYLNHHYLAETGRLTGYTQSVQAWPVFSSYPLFEVR